EVSLAALADRTDGYTGAELEALTNEAAMLALRRVRELPHGPVSLRSEDFARALQQRSAGAGPLTPLDTALVDSAQKLSEPVGPVRLRVTMQDGASLDGELVWADSVFLKLRRTGAETLVQKGLVRTIESLEPEPARLRLTAP